MGIVQRMTRAVVAMLVLAGCGRGTAQTQTPAQAAVDQLTETIASHAGFTEDELYASMAKAGIPAPNADRAFKFTQIAWGRVFLGRVGNFKFAPDYWCFDGAGEVIESGLLSEQPYFVAAMRAVDKYQTSPGFSRFALMSADVQAINKALAAGSRPENLDVAPPALFMEAATAAGIEKAQRILLERLAPPAKP